MLVSVEGRQNLPEPDIVIYTVPLLVGQLFLLVKLSEVPQLKGQHNPVVSYLDLALEDSAAY